jgi:hypothetical protein
MSSEPRQPTPKAHGKIEPSDHYEPQRDSKRQSPESASESSLARMANLDPLASGETPLERAPIKLREQPKAAAGIPAIVSTMKYGLRAMGVRRTLRTFLAVNKVDGFDCQSCAWPSPDTHRKVAEFCENGAKAIADELTHERVTPAFFAQHSIEELLEQSDHWLNKQGRLTHPMQKRPGASPFPGPTRSHSWAAS